MDQNGPFWPEELHFGLSGSMNRTVATPDRKLFEASTPQPFA